MPGVLEAGVSELGASREKAEAVKLWLPSQLDAAERESLCSHGVIASERELRFGQLHDALEDLRRARRVRRGLLTFHKIQLAGEGNKTQTKSRSIVRSVEERIERSTHRYRTARNALLQLDPTGSWQDLYRALRDQDNRGPGKEPDEAVTSDGKYVPSWIWLSGSNANAVDSAQSTVTAEEVNEDMRVEWAQCIARADRWEEEVLLLQEEMRRVVNFLEWRSKDWTSKANARAGTTTSEVSSGLSAYAHKQAFILHNLAIRFCQLWHSKLISLSLSHAWAADFLNVRGAPLDNPDFKKRNSKNPDVKNQESVHPRCGNSDLTTIPPHPESAPTTTAVVAPISTDPRTIDDDDSSDDESTWEAEESDDDLLD